MATATRKLNVDERKTGWLVRNEQGETFGPVDLDTLKAWAIDGRLAPTNEISQNGSDWRLATTDRSLEMDWVAEVTPGTFYGPIHPRAMEDLVKDGSISAQCAFFVRKGAEGEQEKRPDAGLLATIARLTEQAEAARGETESVRETLKSAQAETESARESLRQAQAEAAACLVRERQASQLALAREEQVGRSRQEAADSQRRLQEALDEQTRLASAREEQVGRIRQEASEAQRRLREALDEQTRQAQRNVAAYEGQVRLAQQQVAAYAAQVEQARQTCVTAEARLDATVKQMSAQAEQARVAERQLGARAETLEHSLDALRHEHEAAVAAVADLRAERAAAVTAAEARARAFEAERQESRAALSHAQAETALLATRLAQLEKALAGSEGAGALRVELEGRVRSLSAELDGLRQALSGEKDAAQQAEARCTTLEKAMDEMRALRDAGALSAGSVSAELRQIKSQLDGLDARMRELAERDLARSQPPPVERVYVEAEPVEVLPPERPAEPQAQAPEAERAQQPERPQPPPAPPSAGAGRPPAGLSLAELEHQARRELERLGAHGANLFKRKK